MLQYASCDDDCGSDGDCPGEAEKCCYNGCGRSCLEVVEDPGAAALGAGEDDAAAVEAVNPDAPRITLREKRVRADEGGIATLTVYVEGRPRPDVYWRKDNADVDTLEGRFRIVDDGTLQVRSNILRVFSFRRFFLSRRRSVF